MSSTQTVDSNQVKVWDLVVRASHWSVAFLVFLNYFLAEDFEEIHVKIGYGILIIILARFAWGLFGSGYAKFSEFFPTKVKLQDYLKEIKAGNHPRFLGHNPIAAVMMFALWAVILILGITGFLLTLEKFEGVDILEYAHKIFGNMILIMAGLHAVAAIVESKRHKENLILSMFTGYKRK